MWQEFEYEDALAIYCWRRESREPRTRQHNYRDLERANYREKTSIRIQHELMDFELQIRRAQRLM